MPKDSHIPFPFLGPVSLPFPHLHHTLMIDIPTPSPQLFPFLPLQINFTLLEDPTRPNLDERPRSPNGHLPPLENEPRRTDHGGGLESPRNDIGGEDVRRVGRREAEVVGLGDVVQGCTVSIVRRNGGSVWNSRLRIVVVVVGAEWLT